MPSCVIFPPALKNASPCHSMRSILDWALACGVTMSSSPELPVRFSSRTRLMAAEATETVAVTGAERWFWSSPAVRVIAYWLEPESDHAGRSSQTLSFSTVTLPPWATNSGASQSSRVAAVFASIVSGSAIRSPSLPSTSGGTVSTIERGSTTIRAEAMLETFPSLSPTVTSMG